MGDARERVEASKAARERGHPATCECKGTGLIPVSGFTSGYAPCTRVTIELPPSPEIASLSGEVERLTRMVGTQERVIHDNDEAATKACLDLKAQRDEARASLAAAQEAMLHEDRARRDAQAEVNRLTAESARLREEGARRFNEGVEVMLEVARQAQLRESTASSGEMLEDIRRASRALRASPATGAATVAAWDPLTAHTVPGAFDVPIMDSAPRSPAEDAVVRCTVCGSRRLPLNREGTRFGACSLVSGPDGTGGCPDPLRDFNAEVAARAAAPRKTDLISSEERASARARLDGIPREVAPPPATGGTEIRNGTSSVIAPGYVVSLPVSPATGGRCEACGGSGIVAEHTPYTAVHLTCLDCGGSGRAAITGGGEG